MCWGRACWGDLCIDTHSEWHSLSWRALLQATGIKALLLQKGPLDGPRAVRGVRSVGHTLPPRA